MKILALADEESKFLWDYFEKSKLEGVDLILSCGDLKPEYLSFLATFTAAPVLYVHGNHDDNYAKFPPNNCICNDGKIYNHKGVRILGLGGSIRYKEEGSHQYTQGQMQRRIWKLWPRLQVNHGFDILLAHAPAYGINDGRDIAHTGFTSFLPLMDKYQPKYFVHGHVHMTYGSIPRLSEYGSTQIINAYERYLFEY